MGVLFTNNAYSTLASSILIGDTVMSVQSGDGALFPAVSTGSDYFYVTLMNSSNELEIVKVTNRATDTFTITRAQGGTTARAYSSSDRVELRVIAEALEEIRDSERVPIDASVTIAKMDAAALLQMRLEATTAEMRNGTATVAMTPAKLEDAVAEVTLSDGATIAVDWDSGINFKVTLGGNRALGFPTNIQVGSWRRLRVVQDGTGSRTLAFTATGYLAPSALAPTQPTAAAADAVFFLYGRSVSLVEVHQSGQTWGQIV